MVKTLLQSKHFLFLFITALLLMLSSSKTMAALNGTYTIDSSLAASSTNYRDFVSAVSDLKSGTRSDGGTPNGAGVTGAVTFNVAAGTFVGQLDITAITGVSAANTITFDGGAGNADTRIVQAAPTALATAFTIKINNAQYINLRNITIRGAGTTYGWPLHIFNVSSNVKVKNCIIDFTSSFTLHTNNNFCALVVNNSTAGPTNATTSLVNLEIDSNRFLGGYANYFYGASSNTGIYFRGNSFDSTDYYGLYLYGSVQAKVVNNSFNMKTTGNVSSYGIYFTTSNASTGNFHEISNNKIINCGLTGIYLGASNGQSSSRSRMFNNAIGGGFRTLTNPIGINISNSYSWDVFHNSVNLDVVATGTQATPIYLGNCCTTGATLLDVRNNIFAITAAGSTAYVMYMPNGYNYAVASTAALNYNIYYKQGASISDPFLYNGGNILTMANFVNNSSYNANSFAANPMFTSAKNLQPITPCNNGVQITAVTSSINNVIRNNPPDIGAYEVTPVNDDIGIERITSPALPFTSGTQNVSLLLRNYGSNVVTSANAYYDVNGAGPVFTTWSGSLASCATTTVTFSGANQYNFMPNTQYSIKAYSDYPNSTSDANTINDTTVIPVVFPALSGNYTIDQSSPASATNFVSFSAAALALNNGGVNGPVVFTVLGSTPYAEQMTLSKVQGVSATNTITFDGGVGNAASRIINFAAATQVASHTIRIDNTPWVRIKNLTIRGSGASYAWPVHLMGNNASNEQVRNCIIDFGTGGGVNGTSDNFTGIVVNGGAASISTNSIPNNIDIDSNQITGGNNGIYVYSQGSYNLNIRYNTITNANYYGIYMYYMYGYKCNNNTINMRVTGNAASNGIYSNFTLNNSYQYELMNNVITDAGQYGVQFYYMQGGSTNPARIINNMIGGNFRSTDPAAVYFNQNCQYVNFWFNSLIVDNATSGTQSSVVKFMNSCSNFDVRNNNFVSNNVSANTYILYADATSSGFNNLNYNNYYKVGNPTSRFIFLNGTNYSLANYKGALGYNLNSVSIDPTYTNNKNLKTTLICNNGVAISGVTTDFEGELRNNPPDIGCDENLSASLLDLSVSAITGPTLPIAIGTQNVRVVLRNNGTSTINSAEVNYQVNGGPVQTIFWTGTLNACDTQTVEFNATSGAGGTDQRVTFLPGVVYTVTAFTALPNSSTDLVPVNDTARISNVCTGLSGTFTIDSAATPSATTFTSFASAVTALTCGGISGPVVFNVMQGTYTGQLDLTAVTGANAVNTITFDGGAGNASTRIINFAATSTALPYTLRLNNTQFITLNNLTIRGSGTTAAWPLHIFGTCNAIKVKNCVVDFVGGNGLTGTSDNYAGIVLNNFASAPNATSGSSAATNIEIDSNRIVGGNTSTYLIGNGTNTGIAYRYNIADSANTNGIYVSNIIAPKINNNTVEMRSVASSTTSQGIYLATVSSNATSTAEINRNKVTDAALYGIYVTGSSGIAASRSQMINNSFGGGFRNTTPYGMYFTSSNYWNIWNNSVNIDNAATGTASAIYFTGSTVNDCRNNNFAITNASASVNMYPFRAVSGVTFSALNYNNYHKSVLGLQHIQVNGTNYDTLAYNTATSGGLNSIRVNPNYTATRNLLPTVALNGVQLAAVPTDILGVQRNNPPTMGAYEKASSATTDLGIISVLAPDTFLSAGLQSVILTVKNFGATTINSFNIRHTVNSTNMQDSLFSGLSLATNDVMQIVLDGTKRANILPAVLTSFKVYIHQPNGSNDDNLINDTVTVGPKITSLKGIYTINPSGGTGGTNYTSFRAAINALNTGGVSGPVTFIVSAATYNEQVNIAAITGNSNTNTITFDGGAGNAATRIIDTAANTTSNFWTVRLNVASNIIFRNLTIRASGATYGAAVHVLGNSNFSKFKNCVMEITGAGATSTSANYIPVIINNSTTITSLTTGSQVNNLEFDSNTINNGYYGIYAYSVTSTPYAFNNKFRRNNIVNAYNTGGYFYYQDGMNISNNNINMRNVAGLSSYGLYLYFCYTTGTNFHTVNGNKITNAGNYGIYAYYFGSTNARHSIANNMLAGGFKVNGSYGLSLQYSNNVDVFNNSVNVDFLQTGSEQYSAFYLYSGSSIDVRNNIFATTGGPTNVGLPVYIGALPSGIFRLDNNNYYRANATSNNLIYLAGTYYNAINYLNGGGYNTASFNKNPNWVSANDLHILEGCTKGANLGLLEDFDGQIRAAIPNVGADEFSGANNDIGLLSVAPFTAGLQDIRVVLKNYGSNTITSANVSYSVNGSLAKTIPWSGVLGPCDTVSVSFTGANQYNFAMGTAYQLTAYTSNPNLTADPKTSNDTIILGPSCVFLNGNYTINATGSGVNNFSSFTAAANALTCGGISGPIKFTVAPGTYTEQITLPAIAGSSPTNTITFDGDSAANRIITFAPTVSTEYHTIRINNASNIIFRNLTIQNNGASYGSGVHVMGASNNIKIKNCIIQITGTAATSASGSYAPIVVNNNADGNNITATGSQASGLEIDSNRLVNGYYGIVLSSNTGSPYLTNALIRKNTIDSAYYYGIYTYYNNGLTFHNNTVNMRINGSANSQGVYLYFNFGQGTNAFTVTNNKITNAGQYGMYLYYTYSAGPAYRSLCANNMIGGAFRNASSVGLYCSNLNYWDIFNNSVNLDYPTTTATSSAMYVQAGGTHDIRNNMLVYSANSGAGMAFNASAGSILTTLDYNNYVNNASSNLVTVGTTTYTSSNFIGGGGYNAGSRNQNPGFTSANDLHIGSGCINGTSLASVTTDIDGHFRATPPDIGCDEYVGSVNNDIGVSFIMAPQLPFTAGLQDVRVRLNNFGANTITSANIKYTVNGGSLKTINWTGSLAPCDTTSIVFTGSNQFNFAFGTSYVLKAYSELPNSVTDANRVNDTTISTFCTAFSGVYTINPSGSGTNNFTSISAAANAISCGGVTGPVVFNIAPGTYNEQVTISNIPGASAVNTIIFDGGNAATRTVTFTPTVNTSAHTIQLNSAPFVSILNLTIISNGASYGNPVHVFGGSNSSKVKNCVITFGSAGQTSTGSGYIGILVNGFNNIQSPTTNGNYITGLEIDSNKITYGYYGILVFGASNTPLSSNNNYRFNKIDSSYYYGFYAYYQDGVKVKNNTINIRVNGSVNSTGVYLYVSNSTGSNFHEISNNKVINAGQYGMYIYFSNNVAGSRGKIVNNMIGGGFRSSSATGLYLYYGDYWDVWNNSVNLDIATTSNTLSAFSANYSTLDIRNNHFVYSAASGTGLPFYLSSSATALNYNNYYNAAANNLLYYNSTTYTASTFVGGGSMNANSINVNPQFASKFNLRTGGCMKGVTIAGVTTDIDGDIRNTPPDIGADEALTNDAGVIALTAPVQPITPGLQNITVVVKNFGTNTITSLNVTYNINGLGPVTQALTGITLLPCSTQTVTFTGAQQFNFGGVTNAVIYTSLPNGVNDNFKANDTINPSLCGPLNGVYTINPTGSGANNFTSFSSALSSMVCAGITGPVTFNVAAGTYTEQLDITNITGASAINTITFDGGANNAATRILTYSASVNNLRHTVRFNACQYVNFRNLTIQTTGASYGWGVHYFGAAHNNSVKKCIIDIAGTNAASSTNNTFIGVVGSGSATSETSQQQLQNVVIDSNTINNGYYGIILYGNSTTQSTGTLVRGNNVNGAYYYGVYLYSQDGFVLNNNTIVNRTGVNASQNSNGFYINNCVATTTNFHEINGNKITDATQYGIYINSSSSSGSRSRIWNNMVGGGFTSSNSYGIFLSGSTWDIFQNSVNLDASTNNAQYAALFINSGSNNAIKNNVLAYTATSGTGLPMYIPSTTYVAGAGSINYNNYYKAGLTGTINPLLYLAGNYTLANFTSGSYNNSSISINPLFLGTRNLHIVDGCYNGDSLGVTMDIDGNARASYADIGADELLSGVDDIGVKAMLQPTIPIVSGLSDIQVIVKNYGSNTVIGGTVKYSVNNGAPVSVTFTDTILPCSFDTVTFTGANQFNFIGGSTYGIKVYTETPNGNPDVYNLNDTLAIPPICVGMAGVYTINPTGSGATNYTSFGNAITALLCGGISGPVTFNVAAATYNEQIVIPAIPGASVTNTVVFDGGAGNAATRILVNGTTTNNSRHTVRFDNTSFIQLRNLTVRNTNATYAWPVHIYGNSNNIKIKNSVIEVTGAGATSSSSNYINVVVSGALNSPTTNTLVDSIEIDSNVINGSYASIWDYNNNGTANRFRGNTLNNPTNYGIYIYNNTEVKIQNNIINMWPLGPNTSTGIYMYFCLTSGSMLHEVTGNKIFDMGQYGIYNYFVYGSFSNPSRINNNMIGGGFRNTSSHNGIYVDYGNYLNIDHNSINSDTAISSTTGLLNITNSSAINVRNNIFSITDAASQAIALNVPTATNVATVNYNNYYKAGTPATLITIGSNYSPATFVGGGGYNANSINRDPLFTSKRDLHVGNGCNNGIAIATITTDIDGNVRNNPPDMGADEVTGGVNNNIGVTAMLSPVPPVSTGTQTVSVIISNLGNSIVSSADINYTVNGGIPVTQSWSGTLNPCDTTLVTFTTTFNVSTGTAYTIKAFTSLPNGTADGNNLDDTLTVGPLCPAMAGNYTIDPTGSGATNFTTFTAAANALNCGGIVAPVTFTVANGTYNEQVNINAINGVNDSTTVTFIGQSRAGVVLTYNATTTTSAHTLRLNASPFVNFYNMTIQTAGTTYGVAVHLLGASHMVKIKNCTIRINGTGANGTSQYFIPLLINGSSDLTNLTQNGTNINNIEIDSNRIYSGYYSIYYYGRTSTPYSQNNKFRMNSIDSSYYTAVYAYYAEGFKFLNNKVNVRINGTAGSTGLSLNNCYNTGINFHDISNNRISGAGQYGAYLYFASGTSSANRSRFINNMIGGGFRSTAASGLYWQYSDFWNIYNNTVNLDFATNNQQYAAASLYYYTNFTLDIRNNIFNYTATTGTGIPFYLGGTAIVGTFNYNNFYNGAAANLINLNGTTYTTATYTGGGGYNANSYNVNIPFMSTNDLHLTNSTSKGIAIPAVTTDIDGETRLSPPDIGADEYFSSMDIGVLSVDSPTTNFCGTTKNIVVKLKNYGNQTVNNAIIYWTINGVSQPTYSWTGTLASGNTSAQIVLGNYNFTTGGTFAISAYSAFPNSTTDINANNDSASSTINVTGSVTPTISIAASNSSICSGMSVTFTATATNGGSTPTYQWRINGFTVGTNSNTFTSTALAHGDSVICILSSSALCATMANVVSNHVKMNVGISIVPDVTIATTATTICSGSLVSFTATPVNGGLAPSYQWKQNGVNVGTDTNVFTPTTISHNDSFTVVLTSSLSCAIPSKDTSNSIKMTVNPLITPSVSITAFATSFCASTVDTFTAFPVNAGTSPSFQWKKNAGVNIGTNSDKLIVSNLSDNDSVYVVITSNAVCPSPTTATSNKIGVTVIPSVVPTAVVTSATTTICAGDAIKFNVATTNGGTTPNLLWKKNGVTIATNVDSIITSALANNDTIYVEYTSNATCAVPTSIVSNKKVITVNPIVAPDVTIAASGNNVCAGTSIQFTATPVNGGATPHYQWYKNGVAAGTDSAKYTSSTFADGDSITVVLTSNATCISRQSDTSASVKLIINPILTASVAVTASQTTICSGTSVVFNTSITNGGTTPHYVWKKNGITVGTDSVAFVSTNLANNDSVYVILTSSAGCLSANNITSNKIAMNVTTTVVPVVSITASNSSICSGTSVTFTASSLNGGTGVQYQWKRNGANVGTDNDSFTTASLTDNDSISVQMTSTAACASPAIVTSNKIRMAVTPTVIPAVSIAASATSVCVNSPVTFTATPTNGGSGVQYQWKRNGLNVGTNNPVLTTSLIANNDSISVQMISSAACASPATVTSNKVVMTVSPNVIPTVNITVSVNTACVGGLMEFTATPVNGGTTPQYQWKRNGLDVGTNNGVFTSSSLTDNDSISVQMTSSAACAAPTIVTSNKIRVFILPKVAPAVSVSQSANNVCSGTTVTFTAADVNGGVTPSHTWLKNGLVVGSDSIKYTTSVNYGDEIKCILTSNAACITKDKDTSTASLLVKRLPAKPVITRVGDSLMTAATGNIFQWYVNNIEIPGATNSKHKAKQTGNYIVTVDSLGCQNTSDVFAVTSLVIKDVVGNDFVQLAPNPTSSSVQLTAKFTNSEETVVSVYDMSGKQIIQITLGKADRIDGQVIDLSDMKSGVYLIHVLHGNKLTARKVVKAE